MKQRFNPKMFDAFCRQVTPRSLGETITIIDRVQDDLETLKKSCFAAYAVSPLTPTADPMERPEPPRDVTKAHIVDVQKALANGATVRRGLQEVLMRLGFELSALVAIEQTQDADDEEPFADVDEAVTYCADRFRAQCAAIKDIVKW